MVNDVSYHIVSKDFINNLIKEITMVAKKINQWKTKLINNFIVKFHAITNKDTLITLLKLMRLTHTNILIYLEPSSIRVNKLDS